METNEIETIIENNKVNYNYFGLRAMTANPKTGKFEIARVGKSIRNSYDWEDGDMTNRKLNGSSAVSIDRDADADEIANALAKVHGYDDRSQVVLLGSLDMDYGQDDGEIVMIQPVVLAII